MFFCKLGLEFSDLFLAHNLKCKFRSGEFTLLFGYDPRLRYNALFENRQLKWNLNCMLSTFIGQDTNSINFLHIIPVQTEVLARGFEQYIKLDKLICSIIVALDCRLLQVMTQGRFPITLQWCSRSGRKQSPSQFGTACPSYSLPSQASEMVPEPVKVQQPSDTAHMNIWVSTQVQRRVIPICLGEGVCIVCILPSFL